MRCIFKFFAEDIHLLPKKSFSKLLNSLRDDLDNFKPMVESLWQTMHYGGFSPVLREHILHFNGGLFESVEALPLDPSQFDVLCLAGAAEWKDVEPAIFGTLLERALNERLSSLIYTLHEDYRRANRRKPFRTAFYSLLRDRPFRRV